MKNFFCVVLIIVLSLNIASAQTFTAEKKDEMREKIRSACKHIWNGYKKYAWGYDVLKPVSNTGENWYGTSLVMTPVDGFDTFYLLGLKDEANESKDLIFSKLSFDINEEVQFFEVTIRFLGGLISAYELDGDRRFLDLAIDLGKRLMPVFNTPTGMPYRYVNLQTGAIRDSINNPAEIGTCLLEFGKLTQYTFDTSYYHAAKKAILEVYKRRSPIDLVGTLIDVNTGQWTKTESHMSGRIDSYYEYLYKGWLMFRDPELKEAWETSSAAAKKYLLKEVQSGTYLTRVDMNTGIETRSYYGALDAFYAGLLAYSGNIETARKIQKGNFHMWTMYNTEPEIFNFRNDTLVYEGYLLRPENIESCFYLYRETKDDEYLYMGERMINDILDKCKTESGYFSLKSVKTLEPEDWMDSFFLAETLKYAYLLFAPEEVIDIDKNIFNTEAHSMGVVRE
jgi:Glycosyl hydrolase family 47